MRERPERARTRHVERRAAERLGELAAGQARGEAEVGYLQERQRRAGCGAALALAPVVGRGHQQQVVGLEVAVHDVQAAQFRQSARQVTQEVRSGRLACTPPRPRGQPGRQVAARAELKHDEEAAGRLRLAGQCARLGERRQECVSRKRQRVTLPTAACGPARASRRQSTRHAPALCPAGARCGHVRWRRAARRLRPRGCQATWGSDAWCPLP